MQTLQVVWTPSSPSKCSRNEVQLEWMVKKMGLPYIQRDDFDLAHGGWPDNVESDRS